jgi:hypothetical protein
MAGDLIADDFQVGCHVELVAPTSSWLGNLQGNEIVSYDEMHKVLVYGFEITWLRHMCQKSCGDTRSCSFNTTTEKIQCDHFCRNFLSGGWTTRCGKYCSNHIHLHLKLSTFMLKVESPNVPVLMGRFFFWI